MNCKQNERINQVKESTLIVGVTGTGTKVFIPYGVILSPYQITLILIEI